MESLLALILVNVWEFYWKVSLPFFCLYLACLGVPFVFTSTKEKANAVAKRAVKIHLWLLKLPVDLVVHTAKSGWKAMTG